MLVRIQLDVQWMDGDSAEKLRLAEGRSWPNFLKQPPE